MGAAQLDDARVVPRLVLQLVRLGKRRAAEGLDADEHLEASRARHARHQLLLAVDLRVALSEERQLEPLLDHRVEQRSHLRHLVEVVGGEHDVAHPGRLGGAQGGEGDRERLAAHLPARDLDHRAEVAGEGTAARRIDPEHAHDVAREVAPRGRLEHRHAVRAELLLPAPLAAIDRPQLAAGRVAQDLRPDPLRLGQREAHPAALQHRGVAGHRVRSADDAALDAVGQRVGRQVQRPVQLVALHPDQREQRASAGVAPQQRQVVEIGVDVLVDGVHGARRRPARRRRQAAQVGDRGVRHEPPPEPLDVTVGRILARLQHHHPQGGRVAHRNVLQPTARHAARTQHSSRRACRPIRTATGRTGTQRSSAARRSRAPRRWRRAPTARVAKNSRLAARTTAPPVGTSSRVEMPRPPAPARKATAMLSSR